MAEIVVIEASNETDLKTFSQYLWGQKMPHRVLKNENRQMLLVGSEEDARQVANAYKVFQSQQLDLPDLKPKESVAGAFGSHFRGVPITISFVVLSITGFLIVLLDKELSLVKLLTFSEFSQVGGKVVFRLAQGEYWRLITPVFLHFSIMHLVFNMLWLWDLGRRIEILQGSARAISLILLMGLGSNIAQYLFANDSIFGGMSGVIYGLLGYGWIWSYLRPEQSMNIPKSVIAFMLIWLLLCLFGFASLLGAGSVANAAHIGGLIMGMLLGFGAGKIASRERTS